MQDVYQGFCCLNLTSPAMTFVNPFHVNSSKAARIGHCTFVCGLRIRMAGRLASQLGSNAPSEKRLPDNRDTEINT